MKLCGELEKLEFKDYADPMDSRDLENDKMEINRDAAFPGLNYDVWGD